MLSELKHLKAQEHKRKYYVTNQNYKRPVIHQIKHYHQILHQIFYQQRKN